MLKINCVVLNIIMKQKKPLASISLDLDDQWTYIKIHGDERWREYPSYLNIFIPYVLDILNDLNLKITFFRIVKRRRNRCEWNIFKNDYGKRPRSN